MWLVPLLGGVHHMRSQVLHALLVPVGVYQASSGLPLRCIERCRRELVGRLLEPGGVLLAQGSQTRTLIMPEHAV